MAFRTWEITKIKYCDHVGHEIALENHLAFPSEHLPDQPPRVVARRCSNALVCNALEKPGCVWSGTLPDHQPI
jgi:hypothetical protein